MKKCSKCNTEKPLDEFYTNNAVKSGVMASCKQCNLQKARSEKGKQYLKKWRDNNKESRREYNLKTTYGITLEDYNIMLFEQDGCCAICNTHHTEAKRGLVVDHNHNTGEVRGLLCDNCNLTLGKINDDINILKSAIKYLKK